MPKKKKIPEYSPVPLFHGTDYRIVRMSQEERKSFRNLIEEVIKELWPFFEPYLVNPDGKYNLFSKIQDTVFYTTLLDRMGCWNQNLKGHHKYQYEKDGLYVTSQESSAINYARRASHFGEIGSIAYFFIKALDYINPENWNPSKELQEKISQILNFSESEKESVIYTLKNLPVSELRSWEGELLEDWEIEHLNGINGLRYIGEINLKKLTPKEIECPSIALSEEDCGYKIEWSKVEKTPEWRDYVRIIKDCGDIPAIGDICLVVKYPNNKITVQPNEHWQYFEVPIENVEVVKRNKVILDK